MFGRPQTLTSADTQVVELSTSTPWWLTSVYGPTHQSEKEDFLEELREAHALVSGPWMINGDFNMIIWAEDKNNSRIHRRQMGQFRCLLNDLELKELHLHGRLFTWSNERLHRTLEHIDWVFVSVEWEDAYPNSYLHSLYSACSYHAPLLLQLNAFLRSRKRFHFESICVCYTGFLKVILEAWHCPLVEADPFRRLDYMLRNTAQALQHWRGCFVGIVRLQLAIAKEVVHRLEMA